MSNDRHFDFWYAVNNTQVLRLPRSRLETFGVTMVNYHLLTEPMDSVHKVRVREGRIEASRPQIVTPRSMEETILDNFGPDARQYVDWLRAHEKNLVILQYGFAIRKQEIRDHIVSETLPVVIDQVKTALEHKDDPMGALVVGVDSPWEVCLIKMMVEVARNSAPGNARDLQRDPTGARDEIEAAFREASRDRSRIPSLHGLLKERRMFDEYEDRFFALVRSFPG